MKRVDVDKSNFGETASLNNIKTAVYSPVVDRHMRQILIPLKATSRDIQKVCDFLVMLLLVDAVASFAGTNCFF